LPLIESSASRSEKGSASKQKRFETSHNGTKPQKVVNVHLYPLPTGPTQGTLVVVTHYYGDLE
jgi:hypothetical protein